VPSSAETNGATCQQGDVSHGAQNTREQLSFENLPEVCVLAVKAFCSQIKYYMVVPRLGLEYTMHLQSDRRILVMNSHTFSKISQCHLV
jgi:hypothetical protein